MKLTKKNVDCLQFPTSGQILVWDDELTGFGLRITRSKKTFIVQSRIKGVRAERRVSLGEHGIITPDEARKKAQVELSKMLQGKDPVAEKKCDEAYSLTLRDIADKYIKTRRELKESSKADIEKHLKTSFSDWAKRPAVEITRDKVAKRFTELSDKSPAQANQAFRNLRAILNFARGEYQHDGRSIIVENPVAVLSETKRWNTVRPRTGRIPADKIGEAWNLIRELRNDPAQPIIGETLTDAVSFLLLTGCRWSEMATLTWDRVNLNEGWWHLPDPKNRIPLTLPLPAAAGEILSQRPKTRTYVFPGRNKNQKHIREARGILDKVSAAVGIRISPHDLRRTFRTIASEVGIEFWKTKLLMGHKISGDVTITHYTETQDLRYLAPEINMIADWITRQGVIAKTDKVVPFPKKSVVEL